MEKIKLRELIKGKNKIGHDTGAIGKVSIVEMKPLPQNNSLIITSNVISSNKSKQYETKISFYGVEYVKERDSSHLLTVKLDHGEVRYCSQLTLDMYVQVRCNCPDHYFTWSYPNKNNKVLLGSPPKPYIRKTNTWPERNPDNIPGLCKHLLALIQKLKYEKILLTN